jgi:hypothetical protein
MFVGRKPIFACRKPYLEDLKNDQVKELVFKAVCGLQTEVPKSQI